MGARQLRQWLRYPLLDKEPLELRYDAVEEFQKQVEYDRNYVSSCLKSRIYQELQDGLVASSRHR